MTRLVCTGDLHLRDGDQADDQQRMLDQLAALCEAEEAGALLIAGDIAHARHPSEETRAVFRRFCERVDETCPVVAVCGDHDVASTSDVPWAVLMDGLVATVHHRPAVWHGAGVAVACLPYPHRANLSTYLHDRPGLGPADVVGAEAVLATAQRLREEIARIDTDPEWHDPHVPAVLLGHLKHWIDGARIPSGLPAGAVGPTIPLHEIQELGFDAVVMGDLHEPQVIDPGARPVLYAGSPMIRDFGEAHFDHGCFVLDVEPDGSDARFVPLAGRPWVTIDVDITAEDPADARAALGADIGLRADELPDAVVRVRFRATADQARRVDHAEIRLALVEAGAHRVTVQPEIVRETRARVGGMTETVDELQAVAMWCASEGVDAAAADQIRAYTQAGLEAVGS